MIGTVITAADARDGIFSSFSTGTDNGTGRSICVAVAAEGKESLGWDYCSIVPEDEDEYMGQLGCGKRWAASSTRLR